MALLTVTDMEGTVSSTIHQNGGIVGNSTISRLSEQLFRIYLYNSPGKTEGDYLLFPAGEYVAEEICVACCKACVCMPLNTSKDSHSFPLPFSGKVSRKIQFLIYP